MNTVCGANGEGKSSLIDILSFGLYGQPYRKIRIPELINRTNKKNCVVEIFFRRDNDRYVIKRGLKPNVFEINKNDSNVEMLSSKALNQNEIDKILGVNFGLFKQVIALSMNLTQPFLAMSTGERRAIIETVFNIEVFGEMNKMVKANLSDLTTNQTIKRNELDALNHTLRSNEMSLKDFETIERNWETIKAENINRINGDIAEIDEKIATCVSNIETGNSSLSKHTYADVSEERKQANSINKEIVEIEFELKQLKNDLSFITDNDVCPKCGQQFTEAHKAESVGTITASMTEKETRLTALRASYSELEKVIKESDTNRDICVKIRSAVARETDKKAELERNRKKKETELETAQNEERVKPSTDYKAEVAKTKNSITECETKLNEISHEITIVKALNQILSDSGIKRYFLKTFLPLLNERVNARLSDFNMPFKFNFDESMEANIIPVFGHHEVVSYNSCSEGEKKRFDMAVLLSFIEVIKIISNWDCNIIFFDELLDSAVDKNNLDSLFDAIREIVTDNEQCAYIISHRGIEQKKFDHVYLAEKTGRFSTIKEVV